MSIINQHVYIFSAKNHSIFHDNILDTICKSFALNISNSINAMQKLGTRIYQIDPNSFASTKT